LRQTVSGNLRYFICPSSRSSFSSLVLSGPSLRHSTVGRNYTMINIYHIWRPGVPLLMTRPHKLTWPRLYYVGRQNAGHCTMQPALTVWRQLLRSPIHTARSQGGGPVHTKGCAVILLLPLNSLCDFRELRLLQCMGGWLAVTSLPAAFMSIQHRNGILFPFLEILGSHSGTAFFHR
jgi:hypothetical protein